MTNDGRRKATTVHGGWDDDELFDRAPAWAVPGEVVGERIGRVVFAVQSVVLLAVGIAGLVVAGGTFLGLRLNVPHAVLLLVTAGVVGGAVFASQKVIRTVLAVQTVVYLFVGAFGLAFAPTFLDLNGLDHLLHGVLFILGFIGAYVFAAGILEPGELGSDPSAS